MAVYANRTGQKTVRAAFDTLSIGAHAVRLAAPFFSYSDAIERLASNERSVSLIVRLGPGTHPRHLGVAFRLPTVQIRFFTSRKFHTKLYIFGESAALVGSANLTDSGLQSNREVAVTVEPSHPDFEELVGLFGSYWSQAAVLDDDRLERYQNLWESWNGNNADREFEGRVEKELGSHVPDEGVQVDSAQLSKDKLFLEDYRRRYQSFLQAFKEIREIYSSYEARKETDLPLRIEIHEFLSFVRQTHCGGDTWAEAPKLSKSSREEKARRLLDEWFETEWSYLDVIADNYRHINERLGSRSAIDEADMESLLQALWVCHAFKEQRRFHQGGTDAFRHTFAEGVDTKRLRDSLGYLLHGADDYIERMGTLIYDESYKIPHFGRNVVQELLGWVNHEGIPTCNSRIRKALRCIGFDIQV